MTSVRIATRGSDLALTQARNVARMIETRIGHSTEIVPIKTTGDRIQGVSLAKIGGKGLFVKEIEEALLDGRADVAVHSAKDLPARVADGLALVAFPERVDVRDALVSKRRGVGVDALPRGARVGTGSARRSAQLLARRPELAIVGLRGNVPTRLRKLDDEDLDAIVLACAGLDRLGLGDRIDERIAPEVMLPAVAQGALALEARRGDPLAVDLGTLNDEAAATGVLAERGFLLRLGGDCTIPLGAHTDRDASGALRLRALVASADGARVVRDELLIGSDEPAAAGERLAERILAAGGEEILSENRRLAT